MDEAEAVDIFSNEVWTWFGNMVSLSATTVGIELGLFDHLAVLGPQTPAEIAYETELQLRPLETWARVMLSRGILELRDGDRLALASGVGPVLQDRQSLAYLGHAIRYHGRFLALDFLELSAFFVDGTPRPPARHGLALVHNVAGQTQTMQAVAATLLPRLPGVEPLLAGGCHVLDVGCGLGTFGDLLCRIYPAITYTGIDIDDLAITEGQALSADSPVADRMELTAGDLTTLRRRHEFDVAVMLLALHEVAPDGRAALLDAIRTALKPGGVLIIIEEIYPATLEEADEGLADTGLHFEYSEMLWGSRVPTRDELAALVTGAGFADIALEELVEGGLTIATGVAT